MKKFLIALNIVIWSFVGYQATAYAADAAPETRKVCLDVKDKAGKEVKNKDGSVKQNCKTVKAHKKHEGTKIEDAKKK